MGFMPLNTSHNQNGCAHPNAWLRRTDFSTEIPFLQDGVCQPRRPQCSYRGQESIHAPQLLEMELLKNCYILLKMDTNAVCEKQN